MEAIQAARSISFTFVIGLLLVTLLGIRKPISKLQSLSASFGYELDGMVVKMDETFQV